MTTPRQTVKSQANSPTFMHKVWMTVGIVTAVFISFFLLWFALKEVLAIFAGILLAVSLHGMSSWLAARSFLSRKAALFLSTGFLIILLLLGGFLLAPNLVQQAEQLGQELRTSVSDLVSRVSNTDVGQILVNQMGDLQSLTDSSSSLLSRASSIFSTTLDALVRVLIILFIGFYLAYEPQTYINGLLKLLPCNGRSRYHETLNKAGYALRWWVVGRLASMAIIAVLSIIGLMLLGIPLAFILGVVAGLFAFIPLIGPTLALFPPLLIAFTISPQMALYVFLFYMGIQFVESYFITPIIQRRISALPPVLLIGSQVLLSLFAGLLGVMLAAPLAVTGMVLVKMLYVEDVLQDHDVEYLQETHGESKTTQATASA